MDAPAAGSAGNRRWLGLPLRTLISLAWALPFLVFLAFPISSALEAGLDQTISRFLIAEVIAIGFAYTASWVVNESGPADDSGRYVFLAFIVVILLLQMVLFITVRDAGGSGAAYMLSYAVSPIAIQAPKRWILPGFGLVAVLGAVESRLDPSSGVFPMLIVAMTGLVCLLARSAMDHDRTKEIENAQNLALSREQERTRISADLHDILGQTLTGITVKADLAGRLLDAGRVDDARAQIDDLTEMSREALADVRDVVAANRTLLPETEIESARILLDAAGIRLKVVHEGRPAPGVPSTLVAHVIREGCTNAFRHSDAKTVTITLRTDGASVMNDGARMRMPRFIGFSPTRPGSFDAVGSTGALPAAQGGSGLAGLRERVGARGTLVWGREGDHWILDLRMGCAG